MQLLIFIYIIFSFATVKEKTCKKWPAFPECCDPSILSMLCTSLTLAISPRVPVSLGSPSFCPGTFLEDDFQTIPGLYNIQIHELPLCVFDSWDPIWCSSVCGPT